MGQLNIKEIETAVNQYGEIVIRKNNENNVVVMSMEEYNKNILKFQAVSKKNSQLGFFYALINAILRRLSRGRTAKCSHIAP